jgi:surface antigen
VSPRSALQAALSAAALSAAGLLVTPAGAVNACGNQTHQDDCGVGNIYPCCTNGGNCTWWAWESVCRNWHQGLVNWGNANTWASHAASDPNYDVLGYPVVGSIATRDLGAFGHVAWVVGVSGSTVTVTEENCCDTCAPGLGTRTYAASYFNSGYVVQHGTCDCSPGDSQTEACGDCGTRSRHCDGSCGWGGWGACDGPDPGGGSIACETGVPGPCADGRVRCVAGSTSCRSLVDPSPEVCDGIDNDCNGEVDDGDPQTFGPTLPDFAGTLVDASYPQALRRGEHATVWAEFRNVGAKPWPAGGVWLGARGGPDGGASALFAPGAWPAWNVAASLDHGVLPGETARFAFDVTPAAACAEDVVETFQLQVPGAGFIGCPKTDLTPTIHILPAAPGAGGAGDGPVAHPGGCSQTPWSGGAAGGAGLSLALLILLRARRARPSW